MYPKQEKTAFRVGSAVHWGLQYNTEDLTEWFKKNDPSYMVNRYSDDQLLAESMVHGYLLHKGELYDKILSYDGQPLTLQNEQHELWVESPLKSKIHPDEPHKFVGQIDLLLTTDKGFVLLDYKTSSKVPEWNNYLDQIYRYIMMLRTNFPDIPVIKIGILNLRKIRMTRRKGENDFSFKKRINIDYELNEDNLIAYHEFDPERDLDKGVVDEYIENLTTMADTAETIEKNNLFYQNFGAINGVYKSDFWNLYYDPDDAYVLYNIKDTLLKDGQIVDHRECRPFDMRVFRAKKKLMNKYTRFKDYAIDFFSKNGLEKKMMLDSIKKEYESDDELLDEYYDTFIYDMTYGLSKK